MAELVETQVSRYQEYKPTGVEWMPEIPVGWEVKCLKRVAALINKKVAASDVAQTLSLENIESWTGKLVFPENSQVLESDLQEFQPQDILFCKLRPYLAKVHLAITSGACVGELLVLRSNGEILPKYLFHRMLSEPFITIVNSSTYGSKMPRANWEFISQMAIAVPSKEEQEAIAHFLDEKTAQLDQLITQKQEMLELLREERAALINHVVTKGLDAAAPLRDTGVEWLGEVPAHWEVKRLKHLLVKLEQGWSPSCESRPAEPGEWGVLKVGCVNGLDFDATENKALPSELNPLPEYEINPGDFLISRANTKELVGSAVVVGEVRPKLLLCDKIFRLFFRENANKKYVLLIISSWYGRFQIQSESSGASSSMQNISQEFLKNMLILLPDRHEQHAIVEYVAEQTSRILETADTINQEIVLLQEYRAALIAEAVTGQLDVRHYVPASVLT